jgi:hypothetical protein
MENVTSVRAAYDSILGLPPEEARGVALRALRNLPPRAPRNDTELFDAVLAELADAGAAGLSRTDLLRRFQDCSAARLDETLVQLNRKGYAGVLEIKQPKRGRPPVRYVCAFV